MRIEVAEERQESKCSRRRRRRRGSGGWKSCEMRNIIFIVPESTYTTEASCWDGTNGWEGGGRTIFSPLTSRCAQESRLASALYPVLI